MAGMETASMARAYSLDLRERVVAAVGGWRELPGVLRRIPTLATAWH